MKVVHSSYTIRFLVLLAFPFVMAACAGTGGGTTGASAGTTDGGATTEGSTTESGTTASGTTESGTTGNEVQPTTCNAKAMGVLSTGVADVTYQGKTLTVSASHVKGLGCVNAVDVSFEINGGCRLTLKFETKDSAWVLTDGSLNADANCGEYFPADHYKNWVLSETTAGMGLVDLPMSVDDADVADSCATSERVHLVGTAYFTSGDDSLAVRLSGLGIKGAIHSVAVDSGDCPLAFDPCSTGGVCGLNGFGFECGDCSAGAACVQGYCANSLSACKSAGTGNVVGDLIADVTWTDHANKPLSLHSFCGAASAIWLTKTAGW
jgi:hypothetical protein